MCDDRGERGSVVVAMSVLMLVLLLGSGLVLRSQVELRGVTAEVDGLAAEAVAEQAIAEVLARLAAGERGDLTGSDSAGEGEYKYEAEQLSDTSYSISAVGAVNGETQALLVTLGGVEVAASSLFVDTEASIDNGGTISGRVVTNGVLSVTGTVLGDSVDLHGRDARCDNCGPATVFPDPLEMAEPALPDGSTQRCPTFAWFQGTIDGANGVPYVCDSRDAVFGSVYFWGTVSVRNPPLIVHVGEGLSVYFISSSVNAGGVATDFQLFVEDDDSQAITIFNSTVHGNIYGPGRAATLTSASIVGSVAVESVRITSAGDVWIAPDPAAEPERVDWVVTSWERSPSP